jgi:1-deoxy-D-xylulose-5-phosphate synthase
MLDRAGLTGPDGPTHHGVFDVGYLRAFPNMIVMAPGDVMDLTMMVDFALAQSNPASIRYPKAKAESIARQPAGIELGKSETVRQGDDGTLVACGAVLPTCVEAADKLREDGLEVAVINARFIKPLDTETVLKAVESSPFVITVEEGALMGGFGSTVLEAACDAGLDTSRIRRLGVPDRFVEHGDRGELLAGLGLDAPGIMRTCRDLANPPHILQPAKYRLAR